MRLPCFLFTCILISILPLAAEEPALVDQIRIYQDRLNTDPSDLEARVELAGIFQSIGADERAIPLARQALEIDPDLIAVRLDLARMINRDGLTVEAEDVLRKGLNRSPENLSLRLALAESQLNVRYAVGAQKTLLEGWHWHADDARFRLLLGQVRVITGDTQAARADLQAAATLPVPDEENTDQSPSIHVHAQASFTLALLAARRRDPAAQRQHLQDFLRHEPRHREGLLMAAELATAQQDFDTAVTYLRTLLNLPTDERPHETEVLRKLPFPDGLRVWAGALTANGNRDAAIALLERSAESARQRGRVDLAEQFETWAQGLPTAP